MAINLADKWGKGLSPQSFIDSMEKNQEQFIARLDEFNWRDEQDKAFFEMMQDKRDIRCLIIAADWCGDVVRNIPVVFKTLEAANIPVEVLIMEQHLETMDQFLTFGGRSIPVVLFVNAEGSVLGQWGPRPKHVQAVMAAFKQANPDREAADYQANLKDTYAGMQQQYGEGTGYQDVIVKELRELISSF